MDEKKNYQKLEKWAYELEFSLFGAADIRSIKEEFNLSQRVKDKFDRALSLGKRLLDSVIDDIIDHPTPLYFHHYRQVNYFLDRAAFQLASRIQDQGYQALPIAASQTIDWENQQGHVSHKKIGELAGLGWIGRHNLLVNPKMGSRFRLVSVLTDIPLPPDEPLGFGCGECRECLDSCPARAIGEKLQDFDHRGCFEKLKEFKKIRYVGQYICGVCVKACSGPLNKV
ncbi:epoxyqueuosine reductase [bacterium]|nr:epoxyqueuosine reductase [bacterium]